MMEIAFLKRLGRGLLGLAAAFALVPASASARTDAVPYLEVQQVLSADLNGGGDVLTYTAVAAGINASASTRRLEARMSYRYERRIAYEDDLVDDDIHSGVGQARLQLVPDLLSLDAGALAARSRGDGRGPIFGFTSVDNPNVAEVYSAYAGPTLSTRVGDLDVGASYRLGYVLVDDHSLAGVPRIPGQPILDRYGSSVSHSANASVGMAPGRLPVGWTVGAGYIREDVDRLDQTYEGKYVRGDVVLPISPTLALTAGAGWEDMAGSQQDVVRTAGGVPVIGPDGRLIADPTRPRLHTMGIDGAIYDAGVIWRPSPRTELQARIGRRYGGTTVTGSLQHQINKNYALSAMVYDNVSSFGRLLVTDLAGVPQSFNIRRDQLTGGPIGPGGCVFGTNPGTGTCFDDALQSIDNFNFRARGANVLLSGGRGPWSFGLGAGYDNRRYFVPPGSDFILEGVTDQSFSLSASASRQLGQTSSLGLAAFAGWYDSGIAGNDSSFNTGISANYSRRLFLDRLRANVAAGLYTSKAGEFDSTVGSILFGLGYAF